MTIVLTYTTEDGSQEQVELREGVSKKSLRYKEIAHIDLTPLSAASKLKDLDLWGNQLQSIDLSPLSSCSKLEYLNLCENQLQFINLAPLSACTKLNYLGLFDNQLKAIDLSPLSSSSELTFLTLSKNQLQSIDLSPLKFCSSLVRLDLGGNQLSSIDLTPLSACSSLAVLELGYNQLQSIDLSPLSACSHLQKLDLNNQQFQSIDLSPLSACSMLKYPSLNCNNDTIYSWLNQQIGVYQRPSRCYKWSFLRWVAEGFGPDLRIQHDILCAMGLGDYGFIERVLNQYFLSFPADLPVESVREQVRELLVDSIVLAIDNGYATTGLNIEKLSDRHSRLAKRMHQVIQNRRTEMQNVVVGVGRTEVDLRQLYVTAYGYKVLSALGMPQFIEITDFEYMENIKTALTELGFDLKTGDTAVSGVKMNEMLKKTIWWIAENRGRPWIDIRNAEC